MSTRRPTLAVFKLTSCDGCQLTLLDCEDELLTLADAIHIAHFPEATSSTGGASVARPYDIALVEGSISTPEQLAQVQEIRARSRLLVAIGACATAGGIQALRNFADVAGFRSVVYAHPEYLSTLDTVTPVSAHVTVDAELHGCPIERGQLLELLTASLAGRKPNLPAHPVCVECKARGTVCVTVAHGTPCLGPVTRAGCGARCPAYHRGCYGCFGPAPGTDARPLLPVLRATGMSTQDIDRTFRTFTSGRRP